MSIFIDDLINDYEVNQIRMHRRYAVFFSKKESFGFWGSWSRMHVGLFKKMGLENSMLESEALEDVIQKFMAKRARMASAFLQGMKMSVNEYANEGASVFKAILREHDEHFKKQLSVVLQYFSDELIKAQRIRKVTSAYMQSHLA